MEADRKSIAKSQHVLPSDGKWRVVRTGAARASGTYATQNEAVRIARELARNTGSELYIHGRDGRIHERISYRREPTPSKD